MMGRDGRRSMEVAIMIIIIIDQHVLYGLRVLSP